MSEKDNEGQSGTTPAPEDSVKNLKSEFNRKLENVHSEIQAVLQQNQVIAQQLEQALAARSQKQQDTEIEFDPYDPKSIKGTIEKVVNRQVQAEAEKVQESMRKQQVLSDLFNEYPELRDNNSEMAKATLAAYNSLSPTVRTSADGYKLAVREAAASVGILPQSKRKKDQGGDSFTLGTGSGSASSSSRSAQKPSEDISEATKAFASMMNVDLSKKEVSERVKKYSKRKNWSRYSDDG